MRILLLNFSMLASINTQKNDENNMGHQTWVNVMTRQCLNRRIDDIDKVISKVAAWEGMQNNAKRKIRWQFTTEDARIELVSLYPIVEDI